MQNTLNLLTGERNHHTQAVWGVASLPGHFYLHFPVYKSSVKTMMFECQQPHTCDVVYMGWYSITSWTNY